MPIDRVHSGRLPICRQGHTAVGITVHRLARFTATLLAIAWLALGSVSLRGRRGRIFQRTDMGPSVGKIGTGRCGPLARFEQDRSGSATQFLSRCGPMHRKHFRECRCSRRWRKPSPRSSRGRRTCSICAKPHEIKQLPSSPFWLIQRLRRSCQFAALLRPMVCQKQLYDEALEQLSGLKTTDVVDPASLLFYQGVAYHWLLKKQPGLQAIGKLLEQKNQIPRRYSQMAVLMQADLSALKDDSLDHIDRRMHDVENRLDLAEAGKKVRSEEDGIIASLDKLIEQKEKGEQENSGERAEAAAGGIRSSKPGRGQHAGAGTTQRRR